MIKNIITILNLPRLVFHILFYSIFYDKCKDDVAGAAVTNGYDLSCKSIMGGGKILTFCKLLVFDTYFRNIFYKRIGNYKYLIKFLAPPHPSFIIGTYTEIDSGLVGNHPFSTIINAKKIGKNFHFKNNLTIGNNNGGIPTIGDDVNIGVNVVVVGDISIGNNVTIGTCSLIMQNVPNNSVVVGNPAYIIKLNGKRCKILLKDFNKGL